MKTLTHADDIIKEILQDAKKTLCHQIKRQGGILEIETANYWLTVEYYVEDYEVEKADRSVGIMFDTIIPLEIRTEITLLTDVEGNEVDTDFEAIESYLSDNLELDVYSENF